MTDVDVDRLYATTDAAVWAEEFHKVCPEVDQGLMIGWFANAIETAQANFRAAVLNDRVDLPPIVCFLWDLLDTIDTADDMAKGDDGAYRRIAQQEQKRRWETGITTDGYVLDLSNASIPADYKPHLGTVAEGVHLGSVALELGLGPEAM